VPVTDSRTNSDSNSIQIRFSAKRFESIVGVMVSIRRRGFRMQANNENTQ